MPQRIDALALELKRVIRQAARNPETLEGTLPVLASFQRVRDAVPGDDDEAVVHFVLYRLIPDYLERLPEGADCSAIRDLFMWEAEDGERQSLAARYDRAERHFEHPPSDFGRRQEPRLLRECARRFVAFDRDDRLTVNGHFTGADAAVGDHELSPVASVLWTRAIDMHQRRLDGIREGTISVLGQDGLHEMLATLSQVACQSLEAIDHIDLSQWFESPGLERYLDILMSKARDGVSVTRIRIVKEAHVSDEQQRELLHRFAAIHAESSAELLLCPERVARTLDTVFFPSMGMLLVDRELRPACLTGQLGDNGYIERSIVYLRPVEPLRVASADFVRLRERVIEDGHDDELRKRFGVARGG